MTYPTSQRTDILNAIQAVTLDANGNGQISVRPDVGQYWAPMVVRVSTRIKVTPVPSCVVYHGISGNTDQTAYIDDTALGSNDTSSIIAGITVQFGEAITAVWSNGTPGDTAILIVNGVTLNQPPSVGQLPQVPGTHFAGKLSTEIITELSRATSGSPLTLGAGASILIPSGVPVATTFDMRQYASFSLVMQSSSVATTAFDTLQLAFSWFEKSDGSNRIANITSEFFVNTAGAFTFNAGQTYIQDIVRGPFMAITVTNTSPDTQTISYDLNGSTRQTEPYYRQTISNDSLLNNASFGSAVPTAIPGVTTRRIPFGLFNGRAWLKLTAVTLQLDFRFITGSIGQYDLITVAANTTTRMEIICGRRALAIDVFNGNGGAASYSISGFDLLDKMS